MSLTNISAKHTRAEVAYWVGTAFVGNGYCTEALEALVHFAKENYAISKFIGHCFARNQASARVLEKIGMQHEAHLIQHICKNGVYEDMLGFGLIFPERASS
jgi:[ribosomal protein S5]-alanine N-acetyltransferase